MDDDVLVFFMEEFMNGLVCLVDNGYEFIIIGVDGKVKRIGSREFRRYYK